MKTLLQEIHRIAELRVSDTQAENEKRIRELAAESDTDVEVIRAAVESRYLNTYADGIQRGLVA